VDLEQAWKEAVSRIIEGSTENRYQELLVLSEELLRDYGGHHLRRWLVQLPDDELRYDLITNILAALANKLPEIVEENRSIEMELRWIYFSTALVMPDERVMDALRRGWIAPTPDIQSVAPTTANAAPGQAFDATSGAPLSDSNEEGTTPEERDLWSERWADRALQQLGRWLTAEDVLEEQSVLVVDAIWSFYSYGILPILRQYLPIGITAIRQSNSVIRIVVHIPTHVSENDSHNSRPIYIEGDQINVLTSTFDRLVSRRFADDLNFELRFFGPEIDIEYDVRTYAENWPGVFMGIYVDNVYAELGKIMNPESIKGWLDTPNSRFGGMKPKSLLRDPERDYLLRNLVSSVKHGIFA
jgi:hypothetical protein